MSLETNVFTALNDPTYGVGVDVYPVLLPENPTLPAVTYQVVGSQYIQSNDGVNAVPLNPT